MQHRIVNIRAGLGRIQFVSEEAELEYERQVEAARKAQTVRYAVAPRQTVRTPAGVVLQAGQEVTLAMLESESQRGWRVLEKLLIEGAVLENYDLVEADDGPSAA